MNQRQDLLLLLLFWQEYTGPSNDSFSMVARLPAVWYLAGSINCRSRLSIFLKWLGKAGPQIYLFLSPYITLHFRDSFQTPYIKPMITAPTSKCELNPVINAF